MDRREFLTSAAALGAGLNLNASTGTLPKRPYKNGIELSIIALGGIVICGLEQKESDRRVAAAVERGVNYFDCAPSYFDGEAEIKLGQSLQPFRNKVFLAEKTGQRDAAGAQAELDRTLQRFHTDHVDLYQFHAVTSNEDVEKIVAPGGAAETFFKAKKEGKARHLGFSAHGAPAALRLMDALELDSVLFPVNANTWEFGGFGPQILAKAKSKGMARMALKGLAFGKWPESLPHAERKYQKCWYQPIDEPRNGAPGVALHAQSGDHRRRPAGRRAPVGPGAGDRLRAPAQARAGGTGPAENSDLGPRADLPRLTERQA